MNTKRIKTLLYGFVTFVILGESLIGCNGGGKKTFIDYAHNGSVQCQLEYEGKSFFEDGIGEVNLLRHIDGDTDHFLPVGETSTANTIKSRYYGIDTPESTGRIQEWGLSASNFTKEKVKNADEHGTIVVSSVTIHEYKKPEHDSTGERYVSLIWINETVEHAPISQLTLLNLWIVQEGYSWVKGTDQIPDYADTFLKAQAQAKDFELHLFSKEKDPNFNYGDYVSVSILELKEEIEKNIADATYVNKFTGQKVIVIGNVAAYTNNTLFLQDTYEIEEKDSEGKTVLRKEQASINIYCGMKAPSILYTTVNTRLEVPCTASNSDTFGFQLGGVEGHFPVTPSSAGTDDVKIKAYPEDNVESALYTFEYTVNDLNTLISKSDTDASKFESLNCSIKITEPLTGKNVSLNDKGDEAYINFKDESGNKCKFSLYVTNIQWLTLDPSRKSKTFTTDDEIADRRFVIESAIFTWHRTTSGKVNYQLILKGSDSIKWDYDEPTAISCSKDSLSLKVGETYSLVEEVSFLPDTANVIRGLKWSSEDKTIAKVNSVGLVTAIAPGTVKIKVAGFTNSELSDEITVTVTE